jgi:hypothetical protein
MNPHTLEFALGLGGSLFGAIAFAAYLIADRSRGEPSIYKAHMAWAIGLGLASVGCFIGLHLLS